MTEQHMLSAVTQPPQVVLITADPHVHALVRAALDPARYDLIAIESIEAACSCLATLGADLVLLDRRYDLVAQTALGEQVQALQYPAALVVLDPEPQLAHLQAAVAQAADAYLDLTAGPELIAGQLHLLLRRQERLALTLDTNRALRSMLMLTHQELTSARAGIQTELLLRQEASQNVTTHLQALCLAIDTESRRLTPGLARDAVQRMLVRVRSVALIYELSAALQQDPVEINTVLQTIAGALKRIYSPRKRLPIKVQGEPLSLPLRYASPIIMIVNELITNAFKHAFPEQRFGAITVAYHQQDGLCKVQVIDDGVGCTMFSGRGIAMVRHLVQSLQGTVEWQSGPQGTEVSVVFPWDED